MKKIFFILLLTLCSPAFALQAFQKMDGNRFAFIDLLFWKASVGGSDNWSQVIIPATTTAFQDVTVNSVPFKYNTGYRIGFGYQNPQDSWDTLIYYTGYKTRGKDQQYGNVFVDYIGNFFVNNTDGSSIPSAPYYGIGAIQWKLVFDTLDLELGRTIQIDEILILRPYLGLKGAIINQSMYTSWQNPVNVTTFTQAHENLKNNYWGLGPVLGLKSTWPFYKEGPNTLGLFGNLSGALMWGDWSFSDNYGNNVPMTVTVTHRDLYGASTMGRGQVGLEWESKLHQADLIARLSYEAQVWLSQMEFYTYNQGRVNSSLSLQGGVFELCINF